MTHYVSGSLRKPSVISAHLNEEFPKLNEFWKNLDTKKKRPLCNSGDLVLPIILKKEDIKIQPRILVGYLNIREPNLADSNYEI